MSEQRGIAYVGTSGWKKPQWRGGFYPRGLVQRRELEYASRQLTSLEINSTFHALQRPANFAAWRAETPADFVFAVKAYKAATLTPRLGRARTHVADFFASGVLGLEEKLGPILWQLPAELRFQSDEIESFVASLPRSVDDAQNLAAQSHASEWIRRPLPNRRLRHAIEARNGSFVDPRFVDILRASNVAIAVTNVPELPHFRDLTSDFVYVRLHSGIDHHSDGYDETALDRWAERITGWMTAEPPRDVFAYFNNPSGILVHTPINARRLLERMERPIRTLDATAEPQLWGEADAP